MTRKDNISIVDVVCGTLLAILMILNAVAASAKNISTESLSTMQSSSPVVEHVPTIPIK